MGKERSMSEEQGADSAGSEEPQFDAAQLQYALNQLRSEQNLALGAAAGFVAAVIGATIWALVTVFTGYQIGWMAVGVGFLVGIAVRSLGKGVDSMFGIVGALLALLGCILGNLFTVCGMVAAEQDMGVFEVLSRLDIQIATELMAATFSPIDLLFYGIAVYEGYKISFRQLTEHDIAERITGSPPQTAG
jgi:hypothetical protein